MENREKKSALAEVKHPQSDLFICDVSDAVIKELLPTMEFPFYSLSKKPDTQIRRYEFKDNWLEIVPSVRGAATIYDKDIMIYAISQLVNAINNGEKVSRRIKLNSYQLLKFSNRSTSGRNYKLLQNALDRLEGTRIRTNISNGEETKWKAFGLIEEAETIRENGLDGRLLSCEITLSKWVYKAIKLDGILSLSSDYFRLGKPIERRIYELARKHCGDKTIFKISLELLYKKAGSLSSLREFRRAVKEITKTNHLPDYTIEFSNERDMVTFKNKKYSQNNDTIDEEKKEFEQEQSNKIESDVKLDTREKRKRITATVMDIENTDW